jgi:hypothetical protein
VPTIVPGSTQDQQLGRIRRIWSVSGDSANDGTCVNGREQTPWTTPRQTFKVAARVCLMWTLRVRPRELGTSLRDT